MTEQNCSTCSKAQETVGRYYFESAMTMAERTIKRLWIAILVLLAALIATNAGWIYYESQFEDIEIRQDSDSGTTNFIGNDGDIYNYPEVDDGISDD